jgi:hypothetical protein
MLYYLYKITNQKNGKIYIGVHKTDNLEDGYMGSGKLLSAAIKKYGIENFTKVILEKFQTEKEMFLAEANIVTKEFIERKDTYNIKLGGFGGFDHIKVNGMKGKHHTNKTKKLKSKIQKQIEAGRTQEQKQAIRDKISSKRKGIKTGGVKSHSEESKRIIGLKNSKKQAGSKNSNYGKTWIYSLELKQNKSIPKIDLQLWLEQGWSKGRKINF